MKQRRFLLSAIGLIILVSLLWFLTKPDPQVDLQGSDSTWPKEKNGKMVEWEDDDGNPTMIPESELPEEFIEEQRKRKEIRETYDAMWRTPITFYGKVVDQDGLPIAGATVDVGVNDASPTGSSVYKHRSGEDGYFMVSGIKGNHVHIEVSKDHYLSGSESFRSYTYGGMAGSRGIHQPDPQKPEIFRLQRKGEAVPLIRNEKLWGIPPDGQIFSVDLLQGKIQNTSNSGSFEIRFERTAPASTGEFNWSLTFLSVPNGGFIITEDEFTMVAPMTGYEPTLQVKGRGTSAIELPLTLLFRSPDGQHHARLDMRIIPAYSKNGAIDVRYVLNPSGGRSLHSESGMGIQVQTHRDGSVSLIYPKGHEPPTP